MKVTLTQADKQSLLNSNDDYLNGNELLQLTEAILDFISSKKPTLLLAQRALDEARRKVIGAVEEQRRELYATTTIE